MFLYRPRQLILIHGDPERRVDSPHCPQDVGPELLVADRYLAASVGIVCLSRLLYLLYIGVRPHSHVGVGVLLGLRLASLAISSPKIDSRHSPQPLGGGSGVRLFPSSNRPQDGK